MMAALSLVACDDRPPPVPLRDAGPRPSMDAGPPVEGFDSGPRPGRPDGGSQLPPVDLEVVLPYFGDPVEEDLVVMGEVGKIDVFFSIDTTGSFEGEIDDLQSELRSSIIPELRRRVSDVAFGAGRFEDFPAAPFGATGDRPFRLLAPISRNDSEVSSAVASLDQPLGNGGDPPESGAEALYQIATGEGYPGLIDAFDGTGAAGTIGGAGFREDALRVVVHVTDAPTHRPADYVGTYPDTHSLEDAIRALQDAGIRTLGIASGPQARAYLQRVAIDTAAAVPSTTGTCPTGIGGATNPVVEGVCPLVFDIDSEGSGLSGTIVDAIEDLLSSVRYREVWGETDDGLGFVQAIEAVAAAPPPGVEEPMRDDRRPVDGVLDTFLDVAPGTELSFRALLRNETIPPADYDQIFNLELRIVGDGVSLLVQRVRVIVPRGRLDAGMPDSGPLDDAGAIDAGATDAGPVDAGPTDAGSDAG